MRSYALYQSIAMLLKKKAALYIIVKSLLKKECLLTGASYPRGGDSVNGRECFFRVLLSLY